MKTTQEQLKELLPNVSHNPANVEFVRDPWGMTSELKAVGLKVASSVRGQKDKQDVLIAQLAILAAHVRARFEKDAEYEAKRREELQLASDRRQNLERHYGTVVNTNELS